MAQLTIKLLGRFEASAAGMPVIQFETNKVRELLAYLAAEPAQVHSREALAGLLWPDVPQPAAMDSLRHALAALRTAIGDRLAQPPYLLITRKTVQINRESDLQVDLWDFERIFTPPPGKSRPPFSIADLEAASALFHGPFLDGFHSDSDLFETWVQFRREGLTRQASRALSDLALRCAETGAHEASIRAARRLLDLEPWNETGHRVLMKGLAQSGQRGAALAQFETCRLLLKKEFDLEPEPETRQLYEAIRGGRLGAGPAQEPAPFPDPHSSVEAVRRRLLAGWPALIGRERELAELAARLGHPACRLLTLFGPGGVGKSHLAVEAAAGQAENYPHGVYFVSLAALQSAGAIPAAIAQELGFSFYPGGEPTQELLDYLEKRQLLLLLDNFEHLLEGAGLVAAILRAAPMVKIVVTSRARLNLRDEYLFQVDGLDTTEPQPEDFKDYGAVKLFLDGARRVQPRFEAAEGDLEAIRRICRGVEGMPLAILLAAGWMELLSPAEIAGEISGRGMELLEAGWQDVPERQRSMRAVFDSSLKLLTPREQAIFAGLAVFRGGFTEPAARAVTGVTLRELRGLVDKSMVQRTSAGRYYLHDLLRQYADEALARSPDWDENVRDRHSACFADAFAGWWQDLQGPRQFAAIKEICLEMENGLAAWDWMVERVQVEAMRQSLPGLLRGVYLFYGELLGVEAGTRLCQKAAERLVPLVLPAPAAFADGAYLLARIWIGQPYLSFQTPDPAQLERSETLLRQLETAGQDIRFEKALLLWQKGFLAEAGQAEESQKFYSESLALFRELGDRWRTALLLGSWGFGSMLLGYQHEGIQMLREAIAIETQLGDRLSLIYSLNLMREALWHTQGDFREYEPMLREYLASCQESGDPRLIATARGDLGAFLIRQGRFTEGYTALDESVMVLDQLGAAVEAHFYGLFQSEAQLQLGQVEQAYARCQAAMPFLRKYNQFTLVGYNLIILGWAALALQQYAEARQYLEEIEIVEPEIRYIDRTHGPAALVLAERGLGRAAQALGHLRKALRIGIEKKIIPILFIALPGAALILADQGKIERALELYALAARFRYVANSRWFAWVIEREIAARAAGLRPDVAAAARARGQAGDILATAKALLAEVENGELGVISR